MDAAFVGPELVKARVCAVSRRLLRCLSMSLGPRGRSLVVQANAQSADALAVTGSAAKYLRNVRLGDCSISDTLLHMLQSKLAGGSADAGHLMVMLATSLQLEIQDGALSGIPHYVVERGLRLALNWILAFLDDPRCPVKISVDWSSEITLHAVIRGVIGTKTTATGLDERSLDAHLVPLVLQTFLAVYAFAAHFRNEKLPLHFVHLSTTGGSESSRLLKGVVLLDRPWSFVGSTAGQSVAPPLKNVVVALFDVTIEPGAKPTTDEQDGVSFDSTHEENAAVFRLTALRHFADALVGHGATAVMSQKTIPTYLKTYLLSKGIFSLDRLASSHIRAVQLLSGASLLSDWRLDNDPGHLPSAFGFLSLISIDETTGFVRLERHPNVDSPQISAMTASFDRSWPVSTVVIATPDTVAYGELVEAINTALKVLSQLLEDPEVVAGGGCTEIHLTAWLELQASQLVPEGATPVAQARTLRQLRTCVRTLASLLKRIVGVLCQEQTLSPLGSTSESLARVVEQLEGYNRPRHGWEHALHGTEGEHVLFGWDAALDQVDEVLVFEYRDNDKTVSKATVLDSLQCKREAIAYAVECALVLMRIGSVVKVQ